MQAEGDGKGIALRCGQVVEASQMLPQEPVQAGERHLRLRRSAGRLQDDGAGLVSQLGSPLEQRRLADPGLAAQDEGASS